mgnify:FL=1
MYRLLITFIFLLYTGSISAEQSVSTTFLISLDGFKLDYLSKSNTPNLLKVAKKIDNVIRLKPIFPSVTFPNHVSMVTGRYPTEHGILFNTMVDPTIRGEVFTLTNRKALSNPVWWQDTDPIWVTLFKQGKTSFTLFWPGSEVLISGIRPNKWLPYDHSMSSMDRVKKLISWIENNKVGRPDFVTLYLSEVDSAGHRYGPDNKKMFSSIQSVDHSIGFLISELKRIKIFNSSNLVIVSDHGMDTLDPQKIVIAEDLLPAAFDVDWVWYGATFGFDLKLDNQIQILNYLKDNRGFTCWPRNKLPNHFHFKEHRRAPDIICMMERGGYLKKKYSLFVPNGVHGYSPNLNSMHGILIANGPDIELKRENLSAVNIIEIYPLLTKLLNITPLENDSLGALSNLVKNR